MGGYTNQNNRFYTVNVRQTVQLHDLRHVRDPRVIHDRSYAGERFVAWRPGCTTATHPDGACVAVGHIDGTLTLHDWTKGRLRETYQLSDRYLGAVAFGPEGKTLAAAQRGIIILQEMASGRQRKFDSWCSRATSIALSKDGTLMAVGGCSDAEVWEVPSGKRLRHFTALSENVAFIPGDGTIVFAGESGMLICDPTQNSDRVLPVGGDVCALAVSPSENTIAFALPDRIELLECTDFKSVGTIHHNHVTSLAFSTDGKLLAAGDSDGNVTVWNRRSATAVHSFSAAGTSRVGATIVLSLILFGLFLWPLVRRWLRSVSQSKNSSAEMDATPGT